MNAQQLKNAILQEAIEGRLVPQDPNDEPASVLLDRIRKEKERLVKEGKLKKKDLIETPITEEEIPFEIPESWEWVRLGDVSEIARGGSPRPIKEYLTDAPNGLNWIKIGDTDKGGKYINSCKEKIKPEGLKKTRMVHPGDFLLTNSMSFGRPYITNIEGCIHDGWLMISPYAGIFDQSLLFYVLSSAFAHKQFSDKVAGAVVQNLNSDKVADSFVPLPPLAEQQRIVSKIEDLLSKVEEYGKAQDALNKLNAELPERLKKSILQEAIEGRLVPQDPNDEPASVLLAKIREEKEQLVKEGKLKKKDLIETPITEEEIPFEVPESWEWCRLNNICIFLSRGKSPSYSDIPNEYPVFAQKCNLKDGGISLEQARFLRPETVSKWQEEYHLHTDDILVNSTGTGTVCRTRLFHESCLGNYPFTVPDSHVSVVRTSDCICSAYIYYLFNSKFYQDYWEDRLAGSTNQKELYIGVLQNTIIPLPPLAEQYRIVEKLEQLLGKIEQMRK